MVVLRGGDVHFRLECEHLVVEDVASEHLLLFLSPLLQQHFQHLCGVHGDDAVQLVLHADEVRVAGVVFLLPLHIVGYAQVAVVAAVLLQVDFLLRLLLGEIVAGLAVVGAHARVVKLRGVVLRLSQSALLHLAFIFVPHPPNLGDVDAALHELGHDLRL